MTTKPQGNVPMWDSSDPARNPAPLPPNPNPTSPPAVGPMRPNARPSTPTSPKKEEVTSPSRTSQVLAHRRMNSLQPSSMPAVSVREMGNFLLNGGVNNPNNKARTSSPAKDIFNAPPPILPPLRTMRSLESGSQFNSSDLESLSHQLVGLTNIANNLQKEMAQLSRRSKDNAHDLISLKEATLSRDEDIRNSLRELAQGIGMLDVGPPAAPPLLLRAPSPSVGSSGASSHGGSVVDGDSGGDGVGKMPRIRSSVSEGGKGFGDRHQFSSGVGVLVSKLNGGQGSTANSAQPPPPAGFAKMGMEMQVLERILRDMATKDGENRIIDTLFDLRKNMGSKNAEKEIIGLLGDVREEMTSISEDIQKHLAGNVSMDLVPKQPASQGVEHNDDILRVLERIAKEVINGKGLADEAKSTLSHINEEVEGGKLATEQVKNELLAFKADFLSGKASAEESNNLVIDLKEEVQTSKGAATEARDTVIELKDDVRGGREIIDEVHVFVKAMKDRIESSNSLMDETRVGVADLKGDIRGSRQAIDDTKELVTGIREQLTGYEKESGENLRIVLQELERMTANQKQLQTTGGEPPAETQPALGPTAALLPRVDQAVSELQRRLAEFCDETSESFNENKSQLIKLMKFLNELNQTTTVQTHESREVRKLFEVIRTGVQSMNDKMVTFESEVFTRIDDGAGVAAIAKNFEGEDTMKERRQMWRDIREEINELRSEVSDIAIALDKKQQMEDENFTIHHQRREKVDSAILDILKYQKKGGEMLTAQAELYQTITGKVGEVRALIEEQVLRGILAAQKAGSDLIVAHRSAGEEVKAEVLSLRKMIEDQIIHLLLVNQRNGGADMTNEMSSVKKLVQELTSLVMENRDVQMLGERVRGDIGEMKGMLSGVVSQVLNAQHEGREGYRSEIERMRKVLEEVVGQVLEKQKGFGMGVLEVIKEVKKIVTDKLNSKPEVEVLAAIQEVKNLTERTVSQEDRDTILSAVGGIRSLIEGRAASRAVQDEVLDTVIDIRKVLDDKTAEGNYLGAIADLKEFIEEKDFDKSRADSNVHNLILSSIAELKKSMQRMELGEDVLNSVNDIKQMMEERQVVRAQQLAREEELKHQIGLIQRVLEDGVIRAIVHLQRDLGDGIRGDMAEIKDQGNDVRMDVSEMKRIIEDDVKGKMMDVKIILEDEIKEEISMVKKLVDENLKNDLAEVKKNLGRNHVAGIESHKKTHENLKEVLEAVGDLQTEFKGSQYKQVNNFQEVKLLIQQSLQPENKTIEVPPPALIQYDDQQMQEKLDKVINHTSIAAKYLPLIEEFQTRLIEVTTQLNDFIAFQSSLQQESSTKQVEAAGQAILALEKAKTERALVEQSISTLRSQESTLIKTNDALREDNEILSKKKLSLSAELAAIETTLTLRREQLDKLGEEADAIQRRVVEGVLEQSRALAISRGRHDTGAQALKRINNANRATFGHLQVSSAQPGVVHYNTPRRNFSTSQIHNKSPSVLTATRRARPSVGGAGSGVGGDLFSTKNILGRKATMTPEVTETLKEETEKERSEAITTTTLGVHDKSTETARNGGSLEKDRESVDTLPMPMSGSDITETVRKPKAYPVSLSADFTTNENGKFISSGSVEDVDD